MTRSVKPFRLSRRTLLAMQPFSNVVCKIEVPGRVVLDALEHGVARLPASAGQFPQISGMTMTVDPNAPAGKRVREVTVGDRPLDPAKLYTLAIPDYLLNGGDGYAGFAGHHVIVGPENGTLLVSALEKYVTANTKIAPKIEGRITIVR